MIRFKPDTWLEALLRYLAMVAPDGNVYVEIPAPDIRFALMVVVAVALALRWRQVSNRSAATLLLGTLVLASTVTWLLTSGNGRYWLPMLLAVGPLLGGLIAMLPATPGFRLLLLTGVLVVQSFMVLQSSPWDQWALSEWSDPPYFYIDPSHPALQRDGTSMVTLSNISYSLIAPQFPPGTRWMNVSADPQVSGDPERAERFLREARSLQLLVPTVAGQFSANDQPSPSVRSALDRLLGPRRLSLDDLKACEFLRMRDPMASKGVRIQEGQRSAHTPGFWICPLVLLAAPKVQEAAPIPPQMLRAIEAVERSCPRFIGGGPSKTLIIDGGVVRQYTDSDMKVYVYESGEVFYKFWRALNPVLIGSIDDVVAGRAVMSCDRIRGRSGLPWEREI